MEATWNGVVIAKSDDIVMIEGNAYFPPDSLVAEYFTPSTHKTVCSWKGTALYQNVNVNGQVNANAAWYYPEPKAAAQEIAGRVAFWKGVRVTESTQGEEEGGS
jgi:uncharacterized protein (DUF427 family)